MLDNGRIVAEISGTDAEKAQSLIAQRKALGLDQTEWQELLFQVHGSVWQEVGIQMDQGDAPGILVVLACSPQEDDMA